MSQVSKYPSLNQPIESLIGNDGIVVPPFFDGLRWDVFVIGSGHINTTGSIALHSITINLDGGIADSYPTDAGVAFPAAGILNVFGGSNINTAAPAIPGNNIIINLDDNVHITGTFTADSDITSSAGDIVATLGHISATAGYLSAGTTVTAGTGITSTTGDIVASAGNISATLGSVSAGTTVTGGTGVTATTGNVTATAGNVVITAGNLTLPNTNGAGTQGVISFGGDAWISNFGTNNTFVGALSGNTTLTGQNNTALGFGAGASLTTGGGNVAIGRTSQQIVTTGSNNVSVGRLALNLLQTGSNNTAIGDSAGADYIAAESSNIMLGNRGSAGESNTIRVGTQGAAAGQQNRAFFAGIRGVSQTTTDAGVVTISSDHQLGSLGSMTDGQLVIGSTGLNPVLGNITSTYLSVTNGAGTIAINTLGVLQTDTGFGTWGGAGNYFDDTVLGSFTVLRPGTGYINGLPVAWAAPQTVVGMVAGSTYYIYIDNTGTIQKTNVRTDALFQNNIVLFECLRDSTLPTNNQVTVKENHPYTMPVETSNYLHDVVGSVIENNQGGANITLNGTQGIQINGDDFLADHGLETAIPDSGGAAVTWNRYYTNAGGLWARQNATTTFTGFYNNAGTPTALSANRFAVYRLYASKNNLNTATPTYFAVLHTAQFNSLVAANTAISNGTIVGATTELAMLELAQLGYIVYSQASASIVNVVIQKATLRQTLSTSGASTAALITTNTTNFNNILSAADTNVQAALDTIDNLQVARWSVETVNLAGVVNHGYLANKAGRLDISLPAVSAIGDIIRVINIGATAVGWRITQGAGQQIWIGYTFSTIGAGGYIEATQIGDAIELVCYQANQGWIAANAPQGNITVV